MVGEVFAGLSAFKTMFDLAKGLKDINDVSIRNAAVIELQGQILTAQEQQASLIQTVGTLEKEVADLKTWDAEKKRYQLTDFGSGTFAYLLKEGERQGEPIHRLCARCYQEGHKSILQFKFRTAVSQDQYQCPKCSTVYDFGAPVSRPLPRVFRNNDGPNRI